MNKRIAVYLLLFFRFCTPLHSQDTLPVKRPHFEEFGINEGLSQGMVSVIDQDKNGFMWFATKDGLNKYDGHRFIIYRKDVEDPNSLSSNSIFEIKSDSRGLLWIAFDDGNVDVFNPETEVARHIKFPLAGLAYSKHHLIPGLEDRNGKMYMTDLVNLIQVEMTLAPDNEFGYEFRFKNLNANLVRKPLEENGCTYFITSRNQLYACYTDSIFIYSTPDLTKPHTTERYHYTRFSQKYIQERPVPFRFKQISIRSEDTVSHLMFVHFECIFTLFNTETKQKVDSFDLSRYFPDILTGAGYFDQFGKIWIPSTRGIFVYDIKTKTIAHVKADESGYGKKIEGSQRTCFVDKSGVVWSASQRLGLLRYNTAKSRFTHIGGAGTPAVSIFGIWEDIDPRKIVAFSNNTLVRCDIDDQTIGVKITPQHPKLENAGQWYKDGLVHHCSTFVADKKGYWLQHANQLLYLDFEFNVLKKITPPPGSFVLDGKFTRDSKGNILYAQEWVPSGAIYFLNEDHPEEYKKADLPWAKPTLLYAYISAILTDADDNPWLATIAGLYYYNRSTDKWKTFRKQDNNKSSLPDNLLFSLCNDASDKNILWIGTNGAGLVRFDRRTGVCITYTSKNTGLPNDVIYGILTDEWGNLWISTNQGIARFNPVSKAVKIFTADDGLQSNEFNRYAYCKLANGSLAFGGINGITVFDPEKINDNSFQPNVLLTGLRLGNKPVSVNDSSGILDKHLYATKELHLDYTQNFITFEFASTDYSIPEKILFQYKLQGLDKDWLPATKLNEATYTNLDPGHYIFKVRTTNSDGIWSKNEASIDVYISPPWWATWWFRGFIISCFIVGAYAFYRYRLAQALKLQSLRNRIANDLHDEIGSTLSSISLSSTVIQKKMKGEFPEINPLLGQISSNTDMMMEAMSDIVWAINTKNDRFDNVINRMRAFAIELLEPKECEVHFSVDESLNDLSLDMAQRKNLYLIFKEIIHNAAKYAECKNVWVDITLSSRKINMKIKDDGKGFIFNPIDPQVKKFGGNGLRSIQKRAKELNGEIKIDSSPGKGTLITGIFPV